MANCNVCFRHCEIAEGAVGFCGARTNENGRIRAANYGRITSLALDPIEKKPLHRFYPGSRILSVGTYGCNLLCPFCQNYEISRVEEAKRALRTVEYLSPEDLTDLALECRPDGNIGVAFTYNEPLIGCEYVADAAALIKAAGMKTVMVTNGTAALPILETLGPYIDAMNIDLKGFTDRYYRDVLKGDRQMVMDFITRAAQLCHVELTTLIVPGENDSEEEMAALSGWVAALTDETGRQIGKEIPLHISRFFPRYRMQDRAATDVKKVYRLADVARERLRYVYTGNC